MSEESQNSKKTIKHLRRGLSIYKTGRSPFWHARIYDAAKQKYVVRTTKETSRLEAAEVAEEIVEAYKKKQNAAHAVTKDRSFDHYAKLLSDMTKQRAKSTRNKYAFNDQAKILFREKDGLVSYFGQHDVGKITSGMVRDYLLFLDKRRDQPLAMSTKSKHAGVIRQVLMLALEDGVIDIIPPMPKQRTVDKPRVSFRLDDIDWRAGTIRVRGKGNCHERLPLPPDVGHRLAEYLRHARLADAQGRTVFVRHFAPHHALGSSRVSGIVADAARRAGLGRVHAHRLRHTAATELLRAGATLPEIGQILRHRRAETTAIYAKVDRNTLRLIARVWSGGAL